MGVAMPSDSLGKQPKGEAVLDGKSGKWLNLTVLERGRQRQVCIERWRVGSSGSDSHAWYLGLGPQWSNLEAYGSHLPF